LIAENAFVKIELWPLFTVNLYYFNGICWAISTAHSAIGPHE